MITPQERLTRMRKSFEKDKSVLVQDYKYFISSVKPHVSIPLSKAARMSEGQSERQSREQSETRSLDRTGD